jgi:hypothetical protein
MRKLEIQGSALHHHKRMRKELIPPFNQLTPAMQQIFWLRDLLPEFLWLDSLVQYHGSAAALSVLNDFLSAMDPLAPAESVLDGTISSFLLVPGDLRQRFVTTYAGKIEWAVRKPFGEFLTAYPECPMRWLVGAENAGAGGLEVARSAVVRLLPGKDKYCARIRTLPIVRYFVHGKIHILNTMRELIESLKKYPNGTEDENLHAESFARSTFNMIFQENATKHPVLTQWAPAFWRANGRMVECRLRSD